MDKMFVVKEKQINLREEKLEPTGASIHYIINFFHFQYPCGIQIIAECYLLILSQNWLCDTWPVSFLFNALTMNCWKQSEGGLLLKQKLLFSEAKSIYIHNFFPACLVNLYYFHHEKVILGCPLDFTTLDLKFHAGNVLDISCVNILQGSHLFYIYFQNSWIE